MGVWTTFQRLPSIPIFIGVAGHTGSGKTSAADYLVSRYGFDSIRYSHVLQEWQGESTQSKRRLQEIGWKVMNSNRQAELNDQLISRMNTQRSTVIDGLRHPVDFESLLRAFGDAFALVFIQADKQHRLMRTLPRFVSVDEFEASEEQCVESFIDQLLPLSSALLVNDCSVEAFHAQLDSVVERLFSKVAA